MTNEKLASIIIGCYNQASYLSEAIESCEKQSYPNIEVLVVDDGSTDETKDVAQGFPRVQYLWQENQGVSAARNRGLKECRGSYILFLDGDDRLLPDAIERSLECFGGNCSMGCVVGRYRKVDAEGCPMSPPNRICGEDDLYCALLKSNVIGMLGTVLFRRAALERIGGFDRRFRASEDYDLALRFAREYVIGEHDHLVAEYRWHDRNMSWDYSFLLKDVLDALRAQWPYVEKNASYRAAFRTGTANWRRLYSSLLFNSVVRETKRSGFRFEPFQQIARMVRSEPATIGAFAWRALNWGGPTRSS